MLDRYAVIGGTGLALPEIFSSFSKRNIATPYGEVELYQGQYEKHELVYLRRHGAEHSIPPHKINYRANIAALKQLQVTHIVASNAVGGIAKDTGPGVMIIPDQIIDYSWGREHTFFDSFSEDIKHIDFTFPYDDALRKKLIACLSEFDGDFVTSGCYGCMQGPRLETAAEIKRLKQDGCTLVGMTGMPEAALARELDIAYASICFSVNWAAGITESISMSEIEKNARLCVNKIEEVLRRLFD